MKNVKWSQILVVSASFMVASAAHARPLSLEGTRVIEEVPLTTPIVAPVVQSPVIAPVSSASLPSINTGSGLAVGSAISSGTLTVQQGNAATAYVAANSPLISGQTITPPSTGGESPRGGAAPAAAAPQCVNAAGGACSADQQRNFNASHAAAVSGGVANQRWKAQH